MAVNLTTTTQVPPAVGIFYERTLLQENRPRYIFNRFAQRFSITAKSGKIIKWRRYSRYSAATTPLTEGITPNGQRQARVDLLAIASQYGSFTIITDVVDLTVEDANVAVEVDLQSDQQNNTRDVLTRDVLVNSASQLTCFNGDPTGTLLNRIDIDTARGTLRGNDAEVIAGMIAAGTGQGTGPVRPAYFGMIHTDLEDDIEAVSGFKEATNYAAQKGVDVAEKGQTGNVRWLMTTQGATSGSDYLNPIIAKNAYGVVDISGGNMKSIVHGLGSAGTADPLDQRTTIGWKMWQVTRILNDANIIVLICTNG